MVWTAEALGQVFFSTYPHEPTPVDPALVALCIGLSNTPIWGDLYDAYTGLTGYDPITGRYLMGWERLVNIVGVIPIPGVSGSNARHGVHAMDSLIDEGDDVARFIGGACSFDAETPVATEDGAIPISEIDVGDRVLAWNEATHATGYYTVTATLAHADPVIVHLTINGETIETTPEHPFYAVASAYLLTAATGLLHLRARDLAPSLGRFLSADTVQPNAPGSQGYNLYAYVANNPASWVDPSGHDAQADVLSAIQMLPPLSENAALLGVALGSLIKTTLIIGRSAASWTLSRQHATEKLVLGVFGLVLACGLIERCMPGVLYYSNLAAQAGSDALAGVTAWTASQLQDVAGLWPYPPRVARPQTGQLNLGGLNSPLGPWLQACMLGGVLSGVANLTADAYGYQGTPTQNATIAANVMYNVVTCGAAGGGSSRSNGGGGSNSNKSVDDTIKSVSSRLPQRPGGKGPTAGFLIDSDGNVIGDMIVSGSKRSLPPAEFNMIRDPEGLLQHTQGRLDILHHVELKVARYMREYNLTDATLVLNNHPCSGDMSCSKWLDRTMPVGSNLRVVVPEGFNRLVPI